MPIFEGKAVAYKETREEELANLKQILEAFKDLILNIRVGGTDLSSLFGVRRDINSSIYDILPVRDALSDILNFSIGRKMDTQYLGLFGNTFMRTLIRTYAICENMISIVRCLTVDAS